MSDSEKQVEVEHGAVDGLRKGTSADDEADMLRMGKKQEFTVHHNRGIHALFWYLG